MGAFWDLPRLATQDGSRRLQNYGKNTKRPRLAEAQRQKTKAVASDGMPKHQARPLAKPWISKK